MRTETEIKAWHEGEGHAQRHMASEIYSKYQYDKIEYLKTLFRKAHALSQDPNVSILNSEKWKAYAEGLRHALNLIDNLGTAEEAYKGQIKNSMPMEITKEDLSKYG